MMTLPPSVRVYVSSTPVDMRQGHDGLMAHVVRCWDLDRYSGHIFAFLGRRLDRAKLLYWDRGGFVLVYKRLERGRFKLPRIRDGDTRVEIDAVQLAVILEGIDLKKLPVPRWTPPAIDRSLPL